MKNLFRRFLSNTIVTTISVAGILLGVGLAIAAITGVPGAPGGAPGVWNVRAPFTQLSDLKTAVTNDFHNLGGTETDPKIGTLTTNYVPKWNGTNKLINGSLFDNGNVGIGTNNPGGHFVVLGNGTTSATYALNIADAAGTSNFFVRDDGKVGIGTTAPVVTLDVNGAIRAGNATTVATCGSGHANGEGSQRFNYTNHQMEYCDGTAWVAIRSGICPTGMSAMTSSSGSSSYVYCIERAFRSFTSLSNATATCNAAGFSICNHGEWFNACQSSALTVGPWEMTADQPNLLFYGNNGAFSPSMCSNSIASRFAASPTVVFRCCANR